MSEEKALSSEKNTAERPAPFAAMKNEVEFTSGMESASEQEQKKVKSILLEIESELNAYDRATGLKKIAFSRNFHIRPDLLEKIRSISDIRIQRGIINYYIDSAVHIKTSYIANMMDVKKRENGLTAKEIARTCSITASLLSRGIKDGAILLPPASIAAFCDIVTGQSVAETFFGMPPKIMLPLNLAEVAYRLQITTDVQFEAAERIAEEHHIQNIGMTIDSVTMWERFVEYNTDCGFTEGSLGAVPLRHYETITLRKLQQVAESEKAESAAPQTGADAGKPCPLRPASLCSDIGITFLPTTSSHGIMCFITTSLSQGVSLPMTSTPILRSARRSLTRVSDASWAGCSVCRRTRE